MFKYVLEAMNVVCNRGKVRGEKVDNCVEMVFVDFPSNLIVEGCVGNRVPSWNTIGEQLYEATFQFIDFCLSDRGFITCLYTMEEGVKIEHEATSAGFMVFHRQVVKYTPPVGKKMGHVVTKVVGDFTSTQLSSYVNYNFWPKKFTLAFDYRLLVLFCLFLYAQPLQGNIYKCMETRWKSKILVVN